MENLHLCEQKVAGLNRQCCCLLNKDSLRSTLNDNDLYRMLLEERPYLFANTAVFVAETTLCKQRKIIAAIEKVMAQPNFQERVLANAPATAQFQPKAHSVFMGYDFHIDEDGPQLIEINTNAGGALLNALLIASQKNCCALTRQLTEIQDLNAVFMTMFLSEWFAERGLQPLTTIAIVDENPKTQYMLPEFLLFQKLFAKFNIDAVICDPSELVYRDDRLWHGNKSIDLIYNRLTDFGLESAAQLAMRTAYLDNAVVITPHPRAHALYANKRNLCLLTNAVVLQELGVDSETTDLLVKGIAKTSPVNSEEAEILWAQRKKLFFKPAKGYGSKAVYRGDKLTRRVFNEILQGDYIAQKLVHPSERQLTTGDFKLDLRHYVYQGQTQLVSARLYQGQTTNFRTPGGGFARVVEVICHDPK